MFLPPFLQASLAEVLFTAVHEVRLTKHLDTDRAGEILWKLFNKLILFFLMISCHFLFVGVLEYHVIADKVM